METLPPPLFETMLEFSVEGFTQDLAPRERSLPYEELKQVALVSKSTLKCVRNLVEFYKKSTLPVILRGPKDISALGREVEARGSAIRDVRVLLKYQDPSEELLEVSWSNLFIKMPGLQRLDLSEVQFTSRHLIDILEAASQNCLQMEVLILSQGIDLLDATLDEQLETLGTALERWYVYGNRGGLRQVTTPYLIGEDRFLRCEELVNNLAKFCPRVEFVTSSKEPPVWCIDLETWQTFNTSCTALREFQWKLVPFADSFFRVFGEHVKPQLKSLSLTSTVRDYSRYWSESIPLSNAASSSPPGFGEFATNASILLKGCPALTKLSIELDGTENSEPGFANVEVFGDIFWETAASQCRLLKSIEMTDENMEVRSIASLTDKTLFVLARLKWLSSVELCTARFTSDGVFDYLRRVATMKDTIGTERMLLLRLGGHQRGGCRVPTFYVEIVKLLKQLAQTSEIDLGAASCPQKPCISIVNPYHSKVDQQWCTTYMRDKLKPLLASIGEAHPSLQLQVAVSGRVGNIFSRIDSLHLDWRSSPYKQEVFADIEESGVDRYKYKEAARLEIFSDAEDESEDDTYGGYTGSW